MKQGCRLRRRTVVRGGLCWSCAKTTRRSIDFSCRSRPPHVVRLLCSPAHTETVPSRESLKVNTAHTLLTTLMFFQTLHVNFTAHTYSFCFIFSSFLLFSNSTSHCLHFCALVSSEKVRNCSSNLLHFHCQDVMVFLHFLILFILMEDVLALFFLISGHDFELFWLDLSGFKIGYICISWRCCSGELCLKLSCLSLNLLDCWMAYNFWKFGWEWGMISGFVKKEGRGLILGRLKKKKRRRMCESKLFGDCFGSLRDSGNKHNSSWFWRKKKIKNTKERFDWLKSEDHNWGLPGNSFKD